MQRRPACQMRRTSRQSLHAQDHRIACTKERGTVLGPQSQQGKARAASGELRRQAVIDNMGHRWRSSACKRRMGTGGARSTRGHYRSVGVKDGRIRQDIGGGMKAGV